MFGQTLVGAFFLGSALLWLGALRVYSKEAYTRRRSQLISASTAVAALAMIAAAIIELGSSRSASSILRLLSGINFAGTATTFALAARRAGRVQHSGTSGGASAPLGDV